MPTPKNDSLFPLWNKSTHATYSKSEPPISMSTKLKLNESDLATTETATMSILRMLQKTSSTLNEPNTMRVVRFALEDDDLWNQFKASCSASIGLELNSEHTQAFPHEHANETGKETGTEPEPVYFSSLIVPDHPCRQSMIIVYGGANDAQRARIRDHAHQLFCTEQLSSSVECVTSKAPSNVVSFELPSKVTLTFGDFAGSFVLEAGSVLRGEYSDAIATITAETFQHVGKPSLTNAVRALEATWVLTGSYNMVVC
jgi:hypothetical protein